MAAALRPLVVAMVKAGTERAKIHADADECRAKLQGTEAGSKDYKKIRAQLKGRPDDPVMMLRTKGGLGAATPPSLAQ
eukprot:COSAG02_NODE_348_length_24081_cov_19.231007_17_plen_78_part_00